MRDGSFLAAYAVSYRQMGTAAGRIARRILDGEKPAAIAPWKPGPSDYTALVNRKQAAQWKITVPPALESALID